MPFGKYQTAYTFRVRLDYIKSFIKKYKGVAVFDPTWDLQGDESLSR